MRVSKGQLAFEMPEYSSIEYASVLVTPQQDYYALSAVRPGIMAKIRAENPKDLRGMPTFISFNGRMVDLYPTPDKDYEIRIVYAPPLKEF